MAGQWNWNGSQTFAGGVTASVRKCAVTNVTEDSASNVTLTVVNSPFVAGDTVSLVGLTQATWLNASSQGPVTLLVGSNSTTMLFVDGTSFGTFGPSFETGNAYDSLQYSNSSAFFALGDTQGSDLLFLQTIGSDNAFIVIDEFASVDIQQGTTVFFGTPALSVSTMLATSPLIAAVTPDTDSVVFQVDGHGNTAVSPTRGESGVPAFRVSAGANNSQVQTWTSFGNRSSGFIPNTYDAQITAAGGLVITPNQAGVAASHTGDWQPINFASANNSSATTLTLTSVAASVGGSAVYTGTITGGGNNAFAGYSFVVAGFSTPSNNTLVGTISYPYTYFLCTASTTTTLTLENAYAVAETHAATAKYGTQVFNAPDVAVSNFAEFLQFFSASQATINYDVTPVTVTLALITPVQAVDQYQGHYIQTYGFSNSGNNGTFLCQSNTLNQLVLVNPNGVTESVSTVQSLTLSAISNPASNGLVTITGTITGGASNGFVGYVFEIDGFTNTSNNGIFMCVGSTGTELIIYNQSAVAETTAATAQGSAAIAVNWDTIINYTILSEDPFLVGQTVDITGVTNATWLNEDVTTQTVNSDFLHFDNNTNSPSVITQPLTSVAASTTIGPFTLTSVAYMSVSGVDEAIYTGTITGGANNAFAGYWFNITGFTIAANNINGICIGSSGTTLQFASTAGSNETHAASATGYSAVYTGTITGSGTQRGHAFAVSGFSNATNNGTFICIASSPTTLTLGVQGAVVETGATANATYMPTFQAGPINVDADGMADVIFDTGSMLGPFGSTNEFAGLYVNTGEWLNAGDINTDPNNGRFLCTASSSTTVTLANPIGTSQSQIGTVGTVSNESAVQEWSVFGSPSLAISVTGLGLLDVNTAIGIGNASVPGGTNTVVSGNYTGPGTSLLDVGGNVYVDTNPGENALALAVGLNLDIPTNTATFFEGAVIELATDPSSTNNFTGSSGIGTGPLTGLIVEVDHEGTGSLTLAAGANINCYVNGASTVNNTYGIVTATGNFGGTVANAVGLYVVNYTSAATSTTNMFGIVIRVPQATVGTVTNLTQLQIQDPTPIVADAVAIQVTGGPSVFAGVASNIVTKTGTYTATSSDHTINGNGTFTVTLPTTGLQVGQEFYIKNIGTGVITVSSSVNIDFAVTFSLNTQGQSIIVQWDGTQYWMY